MNRKITTTLAGLALVVGSMLAASPASAHTHQSVQGSDYSQVTHGYTCPTNGTSCYYRELIVSDVECDGNTVWGYVRVNGLVQKYKDASGCGINASVYTWSAGNNIDALHTCEATALNGLVCAPWIYFNPHASV